MTSLAIHPSHDIMLGYFSSNMQSTAALLGIEGDLFSSDHFDDTEENMDEMVYSQENTDEHNDNNDGTADLGGDTDRADIKTENKNSAEEEGLSFNEDYQEESIGMCSNSSPIKSD